MIEQRPKEEHLLIIKHIEAESAITQRDLSVKLGISLGKTNYLLRELTKKGLIKANNFSKNPEKLKKFNYFLTKKGFNEKLRLTYHFLQRKEQEYNMLKHEWDFLVRNSSLK
ncbi:MAG: MarR family EPS-associated transcriptional regulator [Candidatus Omnitrophica bacterium]|nr:MarR family EPS-associated transcriptional regulator [Candidatus Omnitrophota bacterium]